MEKELDLAFRRFIDRLMENLEPKINTPNNLN